MGKVIFTQEEVRLLLLDVGMSSKNAKIGSAISMCEAPFYAADVPSADFSMIGDVELANATWGYSYGGFQIRSLRADKGTGRWRDEDQLLRPRFNARAAKAIRQGSGWDAWSTYTSGMYKAYLPDMYPPPPNTYVVLAGDTLSGIALKLGVSWEDLARVNNLHSPYRIFIGQHLLIPVE